MSSAAIEGTKARDNCYHCSVTWLPRGRADDAVRQAQLDAMKRPPTGPGARAAVFAPPRRSVFEAQYPLGSATCAPRLRHRSWAARRLVRRHGAVPASAWAADPRIPPSWRPARTHRADLGIFVQNHFLSRDVTPSTCARSGPRARRPLARRSENSRRIARQIAAGLAKTIEALPDEEARARGASGGRERPAPRDARRAGARQGRWRCAGRRSAIRRCQRGRALAAEACADNRGRDPGQGEGGEPWWCPRRGRPRSSSAYGTVETCCATSGPIVSSSAGRLSDTALRDFVDRLQHAPTSSRRRRR